MKSAEQWQTELAGETSAQSIREIQAGALREAAGIGRKHDGLLIMAAGWIERAAEHMEADAPNVQSSGTRDQPA